MRLLLRGGLVVVTVSLVLAAIAPGLLYIWGLSNVDGCPDPGSSPALTDQQRQWLRCEFRADSRNSEAITNPWQPVLAMIENDPQPSYSGELAWFIVRDYNAQQLNRQHGFDRIISGMALSIWVQRHWTLDQMEARTHQLVQNAQRFHCPPGPDEWPSTPSPDPSPPVRPE